MVQCRSEVYTRLVHDGMLSKCTLLCDVHLPVYYVYSIADVASTRHLLPSCEPLHNSSQVHSFQIKSWSATLFNFMRT